MRLIGSRRRLGVTASIITTIGLLVLFAQRQSTPFHVGSPVDEIWNYIHTDAVSDGFSGRIVPVNKSTRWMADITTVQAETSFTWRKKPFAIRTTVYSYRNGTVTDVKSHWKLQWPF